MSPLTFTPNIVHLNMWFILPPYALFTWGPAGSWLTLHGFSHKKEMWKYSQAADALLW